MGALKIPILTYHAGNVTGNSYAENDHIALESDLYALHRNGYLILPLATIAKWLHGATDISHLGTRLIGISCDDGVDTDYISRDYLGFGPQKSFHDILASFIQEVGQTNQPHAHITAFVIASEKARRAIESHSLQSERLLDDAWWKAANEHSIFSIENHSLDHRHPALYPEAEANFHSIVDVDEANHQIISAKTEIESIIQSHTELFCYPWGHSNDFLVQQFMPNQGKQSGIIGAFTCDGEHTDINTNPWSIPRYVCGYHWRSPKQFVEKILNQNRP